jgi:hypothetical protein
LAGQPLNVNLSSGSSSSASASASAPEPFVYAPGRSNLFRALNPLEELIGEEGEALRTKTPEQATREAHRFAINNQGQGQQQLATTNQPVGRQYFHNRVLDADNAAMRAGLRGEAGAPDTMMRTPEQSPVKAGVTRPGTPGSAQRDYGGDGDIFDMDMEGKGVRKRRRRRTKMLNGEGFFDFLDPNKNGLTKKITKAFDPVAKAFDPNRNGVTKFVKDKGIDKFVTKTLPSTLIRQGIPAVAGFLGSKIGLGEQAKKLGQMGANELGKVTGMGFKKGSPEMKAHMAKLRSMRKKK